MSNIPGFSNLKFPEVKPENLPYAYALMALGAYVLVSNPKNLITVASAFFVFRNYVEKDKAALIAQITK